MAALGFPARDSLRSEASLAAPARDWKRWAPSLVLLGGAALVVPRRIGGALQFPLPADDALICATSLVVLAAVCRLAAARGAATAPNWFEHVVRWCPTVAVIAIAAALSIPGTSAASLVTLWSVVAAGELASFGWTNFFGPWDGVRKWTAGPFLRPGGGAPTRRLRQQLTRFSDAAGRDVVEGTAVARFAAGQRTASIHLSFCPPFERTPDIACGAAGDVAAEVKVVQSLAYAARFDVKLATPSAVAIDVPVSFSARCSS